MGNATPKLIFQLGTNNWQSKEEFAPGSGILHEQHHRTFNDVPGVRSYSVFPSSVQKLDRPDVRVFELDHDIPICESVSPVSSYRWHSMSEEEFDAYRQRLRSFVTSYIDDVEEREGEAFDLFIAHHSFLNPLIMADVNRDRVAKGKAKVPLFSFVHGTALLMFAHEKAATDPDYPPRFYPRWIEEDVFGSVDGVFVISDSQKERFLSLFSFDGDKVYVTPNGIDPEVFCRNPNLERSEVLADFSTRPYPESPDSPEPLPENFDQMILFVGKFADIKRIDCLLKAAHHYEPALAEMGKRVITVIAGSGPAEDQKLYQEMAKELGVNDAYFIGPHAQPDLARLYNVADLGVFPTKFEAFGLVFLECLACGTPVVGTAAGGPTEFVTDEVGALVFDYDTNDEFSCALGTTIETALVENWKVHKTKACVGVASHYTLTSQCERMLKAVVDSRK